MGGSTHGEILRTEHWPVGHPEDIAQRITPIVPPYVPTQIDYEPRGNGFGIALFICASFIALFGAIIAAGVCLAKLF